MKTLNAKDIETLENTSVASAALAATVGVGADGFDAACDGSSCDIDSNCRNISCVVTCAITNLPGLNEEESSADFVSLLRAALR